MVLIDVATLGFLFSPARGGEGAKAERRLALSSPPLAGERMPKAGEGRGARLPFRMINKTPSPSNQKGALPEKFSCHPWFNAALTKKIPSHRKEEKCDDDVHPVVQEARLVDDEENILGTEPERGGSTRLSGETTRTSASLPNQKGAQPMQFASRTRHACFCIEEDLLESGARVPARRPDGVGRPPCGRATRST